MKTLAVSENFMLTHDYESVVVVNRATGEKTEAGDHYGDPTCGVIAPDESWFAAGGEGITVLTLKDGIQQYFRPSSLIHEYFNRSSGKNERIDLGSSLSGHKYFPIFSMRIEATDRIRFLVDPWSDFCSVWTLKPATGDLIKLQCGPDFRNEEYCDHVPY